jgi:RHS repeat-associated protein
MIAGQVTGPELVHLPAITDAETIMVQQNATVDQVFSYSTIPGVVVTVYAGTTLTLPDGTKPNPFPMAAVLVPVDRLPDAPPPTSGTLRASIVAFQPADTTSNEPVSVTFPNIVNSPPGVNMELDTLDPIVGELVKYGTGTVSSDATEIIPDADPAHPGHRFGISHFDWHGPMAPAPNGNNPSPDPNAPKDGDPVDTASGLLAFTKTDIAFGGARGQIAIVRIYRTLSGSPGPFGVGTNHNYGYLLDTSNLIRGTGTFVNLIMPDGNQFQFVQQGTNTFVNSTIPSLQGAVITSSSTSTYNLRWKNGTVFRFDASSQGVLLAFLSSMTDLSGNTTTLIRGNSSQPIQITQIIDPVGHAMNLAYDNFNRITSITDPIGRTVQYTYNAQGTLSTVKDSAGGVTTFAYDTQNRMTTITDPRGITFLNNIYDANGRVIQQTAADGGVTIFNYTLLNPTLATSPVLLTAVTDPRGNTTTYHFNPQGFLLDVTDALERKTIHTLDPGTNKVLSITDPLGRTTAFTYDANGNTTSKTQLAGTPDAVTTMFTYDPTFNKVTSVTDPLGHTTTFKYDDAGKLLSGTDPLADKNAYIYDSNGEMVSSIDPLGNSTQFSYQNGDVVRITDPLNRTTAKTMDAVGRLLTQTSPLGQAIGYQYDGLNDLTRITDPQGDQTSFTYDGNGNLLSMSDAKTNKTSYAYDSMDRLTSRTDPLGHTESFQYDRNGNLTQSTDRRGVVTTFSYDALNRRTQTNFGGKEIVTYSYDAAGRLVQASDSVTGTIARSYDALDRLISETTPQGKVTYTNDAAGRRTSMAITGQQPVSYLYDNGDRLAQIVQAGAGVTFNYDAGGRKTSAVLPNSVTMNYTYDNASELTGINYTIAGSVLGNLTYTYDLGRRRTAIGGSFARTGMPNALTSASYNAGNQFTQFGSLTPSYDANGNLTSDGVNTYTWDARNQLVSISGSVTANFQYDAFGRRTTKQVGSTSTSFVYDKQNPVEELSGTTVTASLLTGLGVDEYFQRTDASGTVNYLTDAVGSTVALTSSTGALATQYSYEPFGNTTINGNSPNPYQYTGRENDGTGLYYFRARYYSPTFQRFISEDPLGQAGGPNPYAYAMGNPISFYDRLGLTPDISDPDQDCLDALATAHADRASLQRAVDNWDLIQNAAEANGCRSQPAGRDRHP